MDPWDYLKRSDLRTDELKLQELIEKLAAESPGIDDQVARVLAQYPELRNPKSGFMLGRMVAIWTMNFLCRAYGRPDPGYSRQGTPGPPN